MFSDKSFHIFNQFNVTSAVSRCQNMFFTDYCTATNRGMEARFNKGYLPWKFVRFGLDTINYFLCYNIISSDLGICVGDSTLAWFVCKKRKLVKFNPKSYNTKNQYYLLEYLKPDAKIFLDTKPISSADIGKKMQCTCVNCNLN